MRLLAVSLLLVFSASAGLFDGPVVKTVQLEITAENVERLRSEPRRSVPAGLIFNEGQKEHVSVRLKGRGSFQPIDQKPSFTIIRASSPTKFHLNNSVEDPSYLKEKIGSELSRAAGIPVPNIAHARVKLNGRNMGLYVLKEGFTREFVDRSFNESNGRLYDTDLGSDVDQTMEQDLGATDPSGTELNELADALKETNLVRRFERMGAVLDIDQFLTFVALELLVCHWDGYALSRNNFRIYIQPQQNRIRFLPSGFDQIFAKPDLPWNPPMAGLVAKALLETPRGQVEYEAKFRKLSEALSPEKISVRIRNLVAEIRPFLTRSEFATIVNESEHLIRGIYDRKASLANQLSIPSISNPVFEDGVATVTGWKAADQPEGGLLREDASTLQIIAGPKTAASWRAKLKLEPGHYTFKAEVRTTDVAPQTFGERHGASLRIFGRDSQSEALLGSSQQILICPFEIKSAEEVTLICELRASSGRATFMKPTMLVLNENTAGKRH